MAPPLREPPTGSRQDTALGSLAGPPPLPPLSLRRRRRPGRRSPPPPRGPPTGRRQDTALGSLLGPPSVPFCKMRPRMQRPDANLAEKRRILQLETLYDLALALHEQRPEGELVEELLQRGCAGLDPAAGVPVTCDGCAGGGGGAGGGR